jgi:hypothetical protein
VGRVAFKRRVTPLKGNHVFALPYASRLSTFRAPGWGTLAILLPCRWRNATSRKLVPFSHRSASRIFIRQPDRIPSPVVTQDGDHQLLGGEKQAGLRSLPPPSASRIFIILVGAESEVSRSSTSRMGRLATSSSSFWWWKPSSSFAEEASSSHAGEGELLLPS